MTGGMDKYWIIPKGEAQGAASCRSFNWPLAVSPFLMFLYSYLGSRPNLGLMHQSKDQFQYLFCVFSSLELQFHSSTIFSIFISSVIAIHLLKLTVHLSKASYFAVSNFTISTARIGVTRSLINLNTSLILSVFLFSNSE